MILCRQYLKLLRCYSFEKNYKAKLEVEKSCAKILLYKKVACKMVGEIDTRSDAVKRQLGPNRVPACIRVAYESQMSVCGISNAGQTEAAKKVSF